MNNLLKVFDDLGDELVRTLVKNLLNANKKATGQLIKSIDYRVVQKANEVIVELISADYLKYR